MSPAKKNRATGVPNLPDCEWKFECFLEGKPDWAVRWCWEWEFSRTLYQENEAFKATVSEWRKRHPLTLKPMIRVLGAKAVSEWRKRHPLTLSGHYHDPRCATLALSDEIASQLRVVCFASWPEMPFSKIHDIEWDYLERIKKPTIAPPPDGEIVLGPEGKSVLTWDSDLTWVTLKVEWEHQTDAEVIRGLEEWLKQARPMIGKPPQNKYKGEGRRLHAELGQLGLYRFRKGYSSHLKATLALEKKGIGKSDQKLSEAITGTRNVLESMFASKPK